MSLSALSIIIAIISIRSAKQLIQSQDYYSIEFDITGPSIAADFRKHRNNVKKIRYQVSGILGLHENLVEIVRPTQIANGLKIHINLYINRTTSIDKNPKQMIMKANDSEQLPNSIKNTWELSEVPTISNIVYEEHICKDRANNTVNIRSTDEQNTAAIIQMHQDFNST